MRCPYQCVPKAPKHCDGEEHRDGLGPELKREDLARRQVAGARARGGEEEDDRPADGLRGGGEVPVLEQHGGDDEQRAGCDVGAGDHLLPADRVEQVADCQRT
jgi:hypothetical protein